MGGHPSRPAVAGRLERPTRRHRAGSPRTPAQDGGEPLSLLALLRVGFTEPHRSPGARWSLTPPFHPYQRERWRSVLCGTVPRVAPGGCCPPPCPSEPGPSSTHVVRRAPRPPDQPLRVGQSTGDRSEASSAVVWSLSAWCAGTSAVITPRYMGLYEETPGRPRGGGRPGVPGRDYCACISSR